MTTSTTQHHSGVGTTMVHNIHPDGLKRFQVAYNSLEVIQQCHSATISRRHYIRSELWETSNCKLGFPHSKLK
jgi:hypothetical protein